jgi:hypothetical protein
MHSFFGTVAERFIPFVVGVASLFGMSAPVHPVNHPAFPEASPAVSIPYASPGASSGIPYLPTLPGLASHSTVAPNSRPTATPFVKPSAASPKPSASPVVSPAQKPAGSSAASTSQIARPSATTSPIQVKPATTSPIPSYPLSEKPPVVSDAPASSTPAAAPASLDVNEKVRRSLVNILCITKSGGPLNPISGSGVFIDSRGVILTNAHIAQYFLLRDFLTPGFIDCTIRTGSPARAAYKAAPLFVSPAWIEKNYRNITSANPMGTGEHDYALLLVSGGANGASLPAAFPALSFELSDAAVGEGDTVTSAGYAAGFLGGLTITQDLFASSAVSPVREVFTFETGSPDLFSVGGTIVAQKGSSGGAVADQDGKLVGLIVTATDALNTADRDLRAVTMTHIDRSISASTGSGLAALLSGDLVPKAAFFESAIAPRLTDLLTRQILGQ